MKNHIAFKVVLTSDCQLSHPSTEVHLQFLRTAEMISAITIVTPLIY